MASSKYHLICEKALDTYNDEEDTAKQLVQHQKSLTKPRFYLCLLSSLLVGSLVLNISILGRSHFLSTNNSSLEQTLYAKLSYDSPVTWAWKSPWYNGDARNQTEEDIAWSEQPGFMSRESVVALSDSFAQSVGLPSSQRWPWDKSKGVYFIEGLHTMHCLKYLRKTIIEAQEGRRTFSATWQHLHHCVDGLRQFVMCHADDTPRYTGRLHDQADMEKPFAGMGQYRQCRDWGKLTDWATEHSACYRWIPDTTPGFKEEDRYKSCPDGRVLW